MALDFVSLSKPYSRKLEDLSKVLISLKGGAETGPGYPALLALAIQGSRIGLAFVKLFSYVTEDFLSQNVAQFIIRVYQDRLIDVWNERLERWGREKLLPIAETLPLVVEIEALFKSRGKDQ